MENDGDDQKSQQPEKRKTNQLLDSFLSVSLSLSQSSKLRKIHTLSLDERE